MNQQQDKKKEAYLQHSQLFLDALDRAMRSPNGVWVNSQSATGPNFYMRQNKVSAYSALLMAIHSQLRGCSVNTYISYSDAVAKGIRFGDYNGGVQIPYIRQEGYRNRLSNRLITDAEYKTLSQDEAASYRPNFQRFLRMVYNMDQTNFKQTNQEGYKALLKADGPEKCRGLNSLEKECDDLQDFDDNCALYERHMVGMTPTEDERTHYDPQTDVVSIACLNSYPSTDAFLQDGYRAMAAATGASSRLDRNTSTEEARLYEKLVQECVSAMRMAQIGRTGAIAPENQALIPQWMDMINQNPRVVLNLERDVNLANEMLVRAEANEKIITRLKPKPHSKDMPMEDMLALKDILRHGGMVTNANNYSSPEAYKAMLEEYCLGELHEKIEQCHSVLRDNESLRANGQISEETYIQTKSDMYKELSKLGSEMSECILIQIPRPWDYYGRRYISNEVERLVLDDRKELVLIHDPQTKIVNVLLPSDARSGGTVTTASGEKFDFWLDPLEQLSPQELEGATITKANPEWCDKEKIAESIKETEGAKYVRFFETQGALGFYPPNDYYIGKEMTSAKVIDREKASYLLTYDLSNIVHDTCAMDFNSISVIKDENGAWVMNMQTVSGENLSLYPTQADLKIFFEQCRDLNEHALATKKELAQKYYNLALEDPKLNVDIFYKVPDGINPDCIQRVYIYKDPRFGVQMIKPNIRGLEDVRPRPVDKSQFQKLWIAPDIDRYRKALACRIFADIIPQQYITNARVEPQKHAVAQRESFVGTINRSYAEQLADSTVSGLNTFDKNRNFHKGNNPSPGYVSPKRTSLSQSESQSQSYSEGGQASQSQTNENGQTQGKRGRGRSQRNSQAQTQENGQNQSLDTSKSKLIYSPNNPSGELNSGKAKDENVSEETSQNSQNSSNEEFHYLGIYEPNVNIPSEESSKAEESKGQTKASLNDVKPQEKSLFAEEENQLKNDRFATQSTVEAQSQSQSPGSYSQTHARTENENTNKVKEPSASYSTRAQASSNAAKKEADQSNVQPQQKDAVSQDKDAVEASVSIELLNHNKHLKRIYPDSLIVISEEGRAKALNEDAFLIHDIIQDSNPVVYVQHPLSESPKDKIAVLELPSSQFEAELENVIKRYPSVLFSRLEDELNHNKEQGFHLGR